MDPGRALAVPMLCAGVEVAGHHMSLKCPTSDGLCSCLLWRGALCPNKSQNQKSKCVCDVSMGQPCSSCPEGGDTHCPLRLSPLGFPTSPPLLAKGPASLHSMLEALGQAQLGLSDLPCL